MSVSKSHSLPFLCLWSEEDPAAGLTHTFEVCGDKGSSYENTNREKGQSCVSGCKLSESYATLDKRNAEGYRVWAKWFEINFAIIAL